MFLLFTGEHYYPEPAPFNFKQAYETLEKALDDYKNHMKQQYDLDAIFDEDFDLQEEGFDCKWAYVFNTETFETINCLTNKIEDTQYSKLKQKSENSHATTK